MPELISVIIPVYKVDKYLEKCIRSVVEQTYQNLEIILVDDGSPDGCPAICDMWAARDPRIRVIHKTNGGLSSARNAGLAVASGEYVAFVDSDDWIEPNMYELLHTACIDNRTLLSVCGRYDEYENGSPKRIGRCPPRKGVVAVEEMLSNMFLGQGWDSSVWDKLYHRSLWAHICFPDGKIYEDIAIMHRVVIAAQQIALVNVPLYHYYHRSGSIVTSKFSEALFDYPAHTRLILAQISEEYPKIREYAIWMHMVAVYRLLTKLAKTERQEYIKYKNQYIVHAAEIKRFKHVWKCSPLVTRRLQMRLTLVSIPWLSRLMYRAVSHK